MNVIIEQDLNQESSVLFADSNCINEYNVNFLGNTTYNKQIIEQVTLIIESYTGLINPKLTEPELTECKNELKEVLVEYIETFNVKDITLNPDTILPGLALFRLAKVCKRYYIEKMSNPDSAKLQKIKNKIEHLKKEYELIKNIN